MRAVARETGGGADTPTITETWGAPRLDRLGTRRVLWPR